MPNFRKGSWDSDRLKLAKQELDDIFYSTVRTDAGKFDRRSVEKINQARFDIAELIIRVVDETFLVTDPTGFLVDEESGEVGDRKVFQELNSALRVVNRAPGSKPLSQRLTFKEWSIATSQREVNVEIPLEKVAVGRITPSLVAEQMAAAITRNRISTVLSAIDTAVDAVADRTGESGYNLRYAGFTAGNLDKAINGLLDESESPTVFGRHVAIAPTLQGFSGWSESNLDELQKRGAIGTYRGARVVTLQDQYSKLTGDHVIRSDRMFVVGGKKGAIMESKDISFLDYVQVDPRTATFMAGRRIEYGVAVTDKYRYRVLTRS